MFYQIMYKGHGNKWHEKKLIFPSKKNMLNHLDNLKKKGYTNISSSEYNCN